MMQTDVKSATLTESGAVFEGPGRIKGVVVTNASTASSVTFKDGGSSGTTVMTITTPAAAGIQNILIPGEGVHCKTSIYAAIADANVSAITVFYG